MSATLHRNKRIVINAHAQHNKKKSLDKTDTVHQE